MRFALATVIACTGAGIGLVQNVAASPARIGLGSSLAQWRHAYGEDHTTLTLCMTGNFCFGPPVNNAENGLAFRFGELEWEKNLAHSYDEEFPTETTVAHVIAAVRAMLPADSRLGGLVNANAAGGLGKCVMINGSGRIPVN